MAKKNTECKSARVDAVKEFAKANYNTGGWDIVVEAYSDWDIYAVVKHQLSTDGAIRKMAAHIAPKLEYREEIIALGGGEDKPEEPAVEAEVIATIDPAAPNGYFKNGKPKPVSKKLRAQLQLV